MPTLEQALGQITDLQQENTVLRAQIKWFKKQLFGGGKSAIRPSKLGAKNWLFVGHPEAGERAAVIYSLTESCRRRGIDPFAYFRDILARLPAMNSKSDFSVLLPANWKPAS